MEHKTQKKTKSVAYILWDAWCVLSLIGIWPRFIEPNLISTTRLTIKLPALPPDLIGLRVLLFTDLHFGHHISDSFLKKIQSKIQKEKPDLILFGGDMLCYGELEDTERLQNFLLPLQARHGCYAILGNHDYEQAISVNDEGDYDTITESGNALVKGLSRLIFPNPLTKKITERAKKVPPSAPLLALLQETPFYLLDNKCRTIQIGKSGFNVCGLGEYMAGRAMPEKAFQGYEKAFPGIILAHNPDTMPLLKEYPGDIVLSGHTHGGQINLPWLWKKFTLLEDIRFIKGLHRKENKWLYVSRGIGSVFKFRWFSVPEILLLTLEAE